MLRLMAANPVILRRASRRNMAYDLPALRWQIDQMTTGNRRDVRDADDSCSSIHTVREAWRRPLLKVLPAEGAETGVNSTTDNTNTFS